jgi:hypothetical protein
MNGNKSKLNKSSRFEYDEGYTKHTVSKIKRAQKQKEFRQVERALQNKNWKNFDNELYT